MNIKTIKILIFISFIPLFLSFTITKALCDDCILPSGYLDDSTNYTCSEDWISSPSGTAVLDGDIVRIGARGSVRLKPGFYAEEGSKCVIVAGASNTWEDLTDEEDYFSIAVLPDTQWYTWSEDRIYIYEDQTNDIVDYRDSMNTQFVIHLGDMTEGTETTYDPNYSYFIDQLERAQDAQAYLTDAEPSVPWSPCIGNHDYTRDNEHPLASAWQVRDSDFWNDYFGPDEFLNDPNKSWYYGGYKDADRNENSYYYFSVGALKFMVLVLEYNPAWQNNDVIEWAKGIVDKNPDRRVIVVTHGYLKSNYPDGVIYDDSPTATAEDLWDSFIKWYPNIFMVMCGHWGGDDVRVKKGFFHNNVYEVLVDYQGEHSYYPYDSGWYKVFTFKPASNGILMFPVNVLGHTSFQFTDVYESQYSWNDPEYIPYYSMSYDEIPNDDNAYTEGGHIYFIGGLNY